ncbi:MAG: arginase family protein [Chloroflexi bacterium]|nr:arginase family protein [Chloroflexota bacterium]
MEVALIPVPFAQDEYNVGVGRAPAAFEAAGLLERLREREIRVRAEASPPGEPGGGGRVERLGRLGLGVADLVAGARARGALPVVLGGDCINAIGVVAGLRRALSGNAGQADFGVAWFDAHGDFNTPETTLSGYLGGMPLAASCGHGLEKLREMVGLFQPASEEHVLMLGVRGLDPPEEALLDSTPITYLSPSEVRAGKAPVAAAHHFAGVGGIYLHFDIDALDTAEAPGVHYPAPGGLSSTEALAAARDVLRRAALLALTLSAPDPQLDPQGKSVSTAIKLLVEILAAAG